MEVAFRIPPTVGEQPIRLLRPAGTEGARRAPDHQLHLSGIELLRRRMGAVLVGTRWRGCRTLEITRGSNMLNFVRSFADRLREGP